MGEYDFKDVFEKTKDIIHTLDDFTYSGVVAEYLISKDRIESKELVEGLTPYFRRIALPMLHLKSVKRVDAIRLLEEFEVEVAYLRLRGIWLRVFYYYPNLHGRWTKNSQGLRMAKAWITWNSYR